MLPTGFGKSLIYQYFVLAKAKQRVHQGSVCASAPIICPLLSIVDDQIKEAKDLGITACRLKDFLEEETSTLRPKDNSILNESIELLVIDESHTVETWTSMRYIIWHFDIKII